MAHITEKVPTFNDKELLALFRNAHNILSGKGKGTPDAARAVINTVEHEWAKRLALAKEGKYKASLPDIGMLKTMGYTVGALGESKARRQDVLEIVFVSELPLVGSPAYTLEWGTPNSVKRFQKMRRTLQALIDNADPGWGKAIKDWSEDLEFINRFNT